MATMSAHANYLRDLGDELRRQAQAASDEARANPGDAFAQGQAHAFYAVLSLMQQRASPRRRPRRRAAQPAPLRNRRRHKRPARG
jgi:hypothetical protein